MGKAKCEGCGQPISNSPHSIEGRTGYCWECREKAFGFDERDTWPDPRHTEMKDRHATSPRAILEEQEDYSDG